MTNNYKLISLSLVMLLISAATFAQIPNAGFESWHTAGFPSYNEPDSWGTLNSSTAIISVFTTEKATGAGNFHSGSSSIKLSTHFISFANQTAPGITASSATINTSNQSIDGGFPYTQRPTALKGWYKGTPAANDSSSIELSIWKYTGGAQVMIGTAKFTNSANVSTFTEFTAPITYTLPDVPDSALIIMSSSNTATPVDGSVFYVDDLSFLNCSSFTATPSSTNATCTSATGSATITAAGATSYHWSNSATTSSITNVAAGTYTVTANDANGCSVTASVVVSVTNTPISPSATSTPAICTSNSGTATASASAGTGPYTYHWSNNATTATINNLAVAAYQVTITDNNGCSGTAATTVNTTTTTITSSIITTPTTCGASTGSATVTPTNGTPTYNYAWNGGGNTPTINNLSAGGYQVTITDANGCSGTASANVTTPNGPSATQVTTNVTCHGAANGAINVTTTGGTGNITYAWNPSGSTEDLSGLSGGTYTLTITDANSCSFTISAVVNEPTTLTATTSHTDVTCHGANDGTVTITVAGGTSPYSYFGNPVPAGTTTFSNLAAGDYVGNVIDTNGCTAAVSETIIQPAILSVVLTPTDATSSSATDGAVSSGVTGGTSNYSYSWNTSPAATTADLSSVGVGNYCVTITDANSCSVSSCSTVSAPSAIGSINDSKIKLYPNPANGLLVIETGSTDNKFRFAVYSLEGKLMSEQTIGGEKVLVDVKQLPVGFYSYQLKNISTGTVNYGKIQIQR